MYALKNHHTGVSIICIPQKLQNASQVLPPLLKLPKFPTLPYRPITPTRLPIRPKPRTPLPRLPLLLLPLCAARWTGSRGAAVDDVAGFVPLDALLWGYFVFFFVDGLVVRETQHDVLEVVAGLGDALGGPCVRWSSGGWDVRGEVVEWGMFGDLRVGYCKDMLADAEMVVLVGCRVEW